MRNLVCIAQNLRSELLADAELDALRLQRFLHRSARFIVALALRFGDLLRLELSLCLELARNRVADEGEHAGERAEGEEGQARDKRQQPHQAGGNHKGTWI